MQYDRTVIGYHGTDRQTAEAILSGEEQFAPSTKDYDWLGSGIYFWEYGYNRAVKWAEERHGEAAAVVGAIIQLGNCFDLLDTLHTEDLAHGADVFDTLMHLTGMPLPKNRGADLKARFLDCAVINFWLPQLEQHGHGFHTVRGLFREGEPVFEGMAIHHASHIQIAVRDPDAIVGTFRPKPPTS